MKALLDGRDRELDQLKPKLNQVCCELSELRNRLGTVPKVQRRQQKEIHDHFLTDPPAPL